MKVLSAIQPSFLPWRGYFDIISKSQVFIFYDHVQYDKNGWRNRNKILINNKPSWITLPIQNDKFKKKIKDVKLHNPSFNINKVLNTIYFNYNKHPNFKNFYKILENILKKDWIYLSDLNIELTKEISRYLKIKIKYYLSSEFKYTEDKNLNLIETCKRFDCDHYLTGKLAKNYINIELFKKNDIKVIWHEYPEKKYKQFNNPNNLFYEKMSIIDYIFNLKL